MSGQESSQEGKSIDDFKREIAYYKRQLDDQSAKALKQDARLSSLRHRLKQKEQGFAVLSKLTAYIGREVENQELFQNTLQLINSGLNMDSSLIVQLDREGYFQPVASLGVETSVVVNQEKVKLEIPEAYDSDNALLVNSETEVDSFIEEVRDLIGVPYFISVLFKGQDHLLYLISGRKKERKPFHHPLDEEDLETLQSIVVFLSERLEMKNIKKYAVEQERIQAELKVEAERERAEHMETELRAKAAEAQARAAEAEQQRKRLELEQAREVQQSILPEQNPDIEGYEIATYLKTATEVGGDYFDFNKTGDDSFYTFVGDAAGHGTSAGLMMAMVKIALQACREERPEDILGWTNELLVQANPSGLYMALSCAHFQKNALHFSSGGIPPMMHYNSVQDRVEEHLLVGVPLGARKVFDYDHLQLELQSGDVVLIMSDGLAEVINEANVQWGYENIAKSMQEVSDQSPYTIIDHLLDQCLTWKGDGEIDDDITLVVIKKQ
ncbi:MAG: PP2C family protein-serine/threonine phosphatase [Bacteroidota bacterium]